MDYILPTCLIHQVFGAGDASFYEDNVKIYTGHVIPHGYYKMIHRDSFIAEASFYYRLIGFAVFFTLSRMAVGRFLVRPLAKPLALKSTGHPKLEEAIMMFSYYLWSSSYNISYLVHQDWFWHPILCFLDGFPRTSLEPEISFYYSAQIGWYLHEVYSHFCLDTKKSDFTIMIVHHVVTLSLLYGAFVVGYFRIGMLVMLSMDVCDIFLYGAKILKVVKSGGQVDYPKVIYYVGFGMIPVSWFSLRLVYFPFVIMRTTFIDSLCSAGYRNADGWLGFNILLFILLGLNAWWFWIIAKIMFSSLTSKNLQALDDIREKDGSPREPTSGKHKTHKDHDQPCKQTQTKKPKKNQ